jgi:hypothetical protein
MLDLFRTCVFLSSFGNDSIHIQLISLRFGHLDLRHLRAIKLLLIFFAIGFRET